MIWLFLGVAITAAAIFWAIWRSRATRRRCAAVYAKPLDLFSLPGIPPRGVVVGRAAEPLRSGQLVVEAPWPPAAPLGTVPFTPYGIGNEEPTVTEFTPPAPANDGGFGGAGASSTWDGPSTNDGASYSGDTGGGDFSGGSDP